MDEIWNEFVMINLVGFTVRNSVEHVFLSVDKMFEIFDKNPSNQVHVSNGQGGHAKEVDPVDLVPLRLFVHLFDNVVSVSIL